MLFGFLGPRRTNYTGVGPLVTDPARPTMWACVFVILDWWAEKDSNLRSLPTTDLQSVPIGHSGTCPIPCQPSLALNREFAHSQPWAREHDHSTRFEERADRFKLVQHQYGEPSWIGRTAWP